MGGVSWSVHNKLKEERDKQKGIINDLEKKNEELKRRYEERQKEIKIQKDLKEKEEREFQNKKTAALKDMDNSLKKKQEEQMNLIENELIKLSEIWCEEDIEEIDFEKIIKECYEQLFKFENLEKIIKENVKQLIKDLIKENEIKHLNIQIIGKTGVGKSTLVNAIFGEKVAEEKKGEPCTMETKCYENKKYDFIRIYDTRGIEISKNFDIDTVFNTTFQEIIDKCEKNEPDNLIHCLLYCFTGTRFEREEGEILVKLRKTYQGKKLPIIIVLTQDIGGEEDDDDDEEEKEGNKQFIESINKIFEEKCDESLSDKVSSISFVKILAKKKKISKISIPPKGLDVLIKKCLEKGEYSSKFACLSAIKISAEKKIREDYLKIKKNILIEKDRFFDVLFNKPSLNNIFEDIIEKVFMTFSLMEHRELVTKENFEYIKIINNKIIKLILEKEEKIFRDFLEKKADYIAKILMDEQTSIEKKYDFGFGNNIKDSNEFAFKLTGIIKMKFKDLSKANAIKNAAKIVSLKIIDLFMECFINSYLKEVKSDEIKTYLENSINGCLSSELKNKVEGLIKDLKKYQENKETPSSK